MKETSLRPHQKRILENNPPRALLVHAMRTGKSLILERWSNHPCRNKNAYIICTKKNKREWEERCPHATVWTKEEFKKNQRSLVDPTCVGIDEFHHFLSPLYIAKKRSQQAEALYTMFKKYPNVDRLFLTGTPLTNDPACVHTAITFLGTYIPWGKYRDEFYELRRLPFLPRPAYFPIEDWREGANRLLQNFADVVSLEDVVDHLPPVTDEIVNIKTPPKKYAAGEDRTWTTEHQHEQTEKHKWILEMGGKARKLIVVCYYRNQIDSLEASLSKQKPVYVLDGRTKDQAAVIKEAQNSLDCFFIVQAATGEGWDGYHFDAMIFASMPHRVIYHTQMKARLDTAERHHMKPKLYFYLLGGYWDKKIYDSIRAGEDFNPLKRVVE